MQSAGQCGRGVLVQVLQNPSGRLPASRCHGEQNAFQVSNNRKYMPINFVKRVGYVTVYLNLSLIIDYNYIPLLIIAVNMNPI